MRFRSVVVVLSVCTTLAVACGKNEKPPPKSKGVTTGQESGPGGTASHGGGGGTVVAGPDAAKQIFSQTCAMCHGLDGTGNTPMAQNFNPPPRNYTDAAWQASVTDDQIKEIILKGSKAVGKSEGMPPHEAMLKDKPGALEGLVAIVRGFKK